MEWALKRHFSEDHVFDTGIVAGTVTYRDTTGTSRSSWTSRTSFTLKEMEENIMTLRRKSSLQSGQQWSCGTDTYSEYLPMERVLLKMLLT